MDTERSPATGVTLGSARFRAVIGMSLFIMLGFGLIIPALPLFAERFGVGEAGVGLVIMAFALTRLVGDLFAGNLIDRFGERTIAAAGVAIVGVSSLAAGAAQSFLQLLVFRGAGGIGSAFFLGGLMAYLVGSIPADSRGRAMGVFQASFGIGLLIGPVVGGIVVALTSVNVPLYLYGAICLVCVPLTMRALHGEHLPSRALADAPELEEVVVPVPGERTWAKLLPLLRNPTYLAALATSGLIFFIVSAEQTLIPGLWIKRLHHSEATSGIPFFAAALAGLVVIYHAGGLSDRRGRKFVLIPAIIVTIASAALVGYAPDALTFIVLLGVLGAAGGYMRPGPTAMVADVAPAHARGVAVSGYRIAGDLGSLVGPIVVGVIAQYVNLSAGFVAVAVVGLAVLALVGRATETVPSVE